MLTRTDTRWALNRGWIGGNWNCHSWGGALTLTRTILKNAAFSPTARGQKIDANFFALSFIRKMQSSSLFVGLIFKTHTLGTFCPLTILGKFQLISREFRRIRPKSSADKMFRACELKDQTYKKSRTLHFPAKSKRGREEGDGTENVINCRDVCRTLRCAHSSSQALRLLTYALMRSHRIL